MTTTAARPDFDVAVHVYVYFNVCWQLFREVIVSFDFGLPLKQMNLLCYLNSPKY